MRMRKASDDHFAGGLEDGFGLSAEHSDSARADHSATRGRIVREAVARIGRAIGGVGLVSGLRLVRLTVPLPGVALGIGLGVLAIAGRVASAIDLTVVRPGLAARDDASIAALSHHPAVAEVGPVTADIQVQVMCGTVSGPADADRIAQCDPVRAGSDGESMTEVDAVFRAAFCLCELEHSAGVGPCSGTAACDVNP